MEDISRMSNQERIALLGVEEADKYRGKPQRTNDMVDYLPAITKEGGAFYLAQLSLKDEAKKRGQDYKILPTPQEFVIPTQKAPRREKVRKNVQISQELD